MELFSFPSCLPWGKGRKSKWQRRNWRPNCLQPQLELQRNILKSNFQQRFMPRYPFSFFLSVIEASLLPCYNFRAESNFSTRSCKHLLEGHSNYDGPLLIQVRYSQLWLPRAASLQVWLHAGLRQRPTTQIPGTERKRTLGKYLSCCSKLTCAVEVLEPCSFWNWPLWAWNDEGESKHNDQAEEEGDEEGSSAPPGQPGQPRGLDNPPLHVVFMVLLSFYILSLERVDLSFWVLVIHHSSFIGVHTAFSSFTCNNGKRSQNPVLNIF